MAKNMIIEAQMHQDCQAGHLGPSLIKAIYTLLLTTLDAVRFVLDLGVV